MYDRLAEKHRDAVVSNAVEEGAALYWRPAGVPAKGAVSPSLEGHICSAREHHLPWLESIQC